MSPSVASKEEMNYFLFGIILGVAIIVTFEIYWLHVNCKRQPLTVLTLWSVIAGLSLLFWPLILLNLIFGKNDRVMVFVNKIEKEVKNGF